MPRTAKAKVTPKMRKRTRATNVHVHIHPPAQPSEEEKAEFMQELFDSNPDGLSDDGPDSDSLA
jgi:hypothetical protein